VQLIKRLCETYGPAGHEDRVRSLIKTTIKGLVDSMHVDSMGNLVAHLAGKGDRIMVCAHMDEIGLIVTYIDRRGFLRFAPLGGVYPNRLVATRVEFENGTIGVVHQETRNTADQPLKFEKLFIDIGCDDQKSARQKVRIGDLAAFQRSLQVIGPRLVAKAMDDRIGCYVLIEALRRVARQKKSQRRHDLYFVFTVQEEVGLRGAMTSAYGIAPDYGLSVDVTGTGDTPEADKMEVRLGQGTAIKVRDRMMISHPMIRNGLESLCRRQRIPYQLEVLEWGTTDAAVMQISREGVPSGTISVPARYVHSLSEMVDVGDVEASIRLLTAFLLAGAK
jgi:endoglucanase